MVIERSPGGQAAGGGQSTSKSTCEVPAWTALTAFGDRSASRMSKQRPAWTLTPEMIPFGTKSVMLSMLIDLLTIVHVARCRWRSHQLTSDLKRCLLFRKCLRWSSRKAVSSFGAFVRVCQRGPGGFTATSDLVRCMYVTLVAVKGLSRCGLVGSCVLPGEDFFP